METKKRDWEAAIELLIVIMLGVTALLTAWATWLGSLHEGNQAGNYTKSNNLASEGNSEYNAGVQQMNQDMLLWNNISSEQVEIIFAQSSGDQDTLDKACYQLFFLLNENLSETMAAAVDWDMNLTDEQIADPTSTILSWMEKENATTSPFYSQDYVDSYFTAANELLAQSQEALEQGEKDNQHGDAFGLVTVIYSVVLFLLGIASSFKNKRSKNIVVIISLVGFVIATVYMCTIPLPTGFSLTSYFGG